MMKSQNIRIFLSIIWICLIIPAVVVAQPNKTYFNLDEAIANPEQVYKLYLKNTDELPAEILQFKNLKELTLSEPIQYPEKLSVLTGLEKLSLLYHKISEIPESIGQLKSLKSLKITGKNQPVSLPNSIGDLVNLKVLELTQNQLSSIPDISNLTGLTKINLGYNKISQLPDVFKKMESLNELLLSKNEINTLPPSIGKLKQLKILNLENNKFAVFPKELYGCTNLQNLDLNRNELYNLPGDIGNLKELLKLNLSDNKFTDISTAISGLRKLEELDISKNAFDQILPDAVYSLVALKKLSYSIFKMKFEDNYKPQPLGAGICALQNLEELSINAIELTSLPTCFGSLKKLKRLNIFMSPKSYLFPPEIVQLTNLERLKFISRGYPIRELPAGIRNLSKLKSMELGKAQFSDAQKSQLKNELPNCRIKIK